jgi:Interleukin-like EMT inducer
MSFAKRVVVLIFLSGLSSCGTNAEGLMVAGEGENERSDVSRGAPMPSYPPPIPPTPPDAGAMPDGGSVQTVAGCPVGQVHCSGKVPQICGADGTWLNAAPCAYACQGGCVNRFAAVSSGYGSPTNADGVAEFAVNTETFYSERGTLLGARGFNVAVLDPASGRRLEPVRNFDAWTSPLSGNALTSLADYLDALEPGRLVMIAVCDDAGMTPIDSCERSGSPPVRRLVETLQRMGSEKIATYCYRGAWSFVAITGQPRALAEKVSAGPKITAEVLLPAGPAAEPYP